MKYIEYISISLQNKATDLAQTFLEPANSTHRQYEALRAYFVEGVPSAEAARVGNGYERAKSRHIFRDFIDATAFIEIDERDILVRFQKRAHNPLLLEAGFDKTNIRIPWLGNRHLTFAFG